MPLKREQFIRLLLREVKFFPARARIREEYEAHFADAVERLRCQGKSEEEAEALAAERMGDPVELGRALNRVHSPLIGWLLYLSRAALAVMSVCVALAVSCELVVILSRWNYTIRPANKPFVREIEGEWAVALDGEYAVVHGVAQEEDGTLQVAVEEFLFPGTPRTFTCGGFLLGDGQGVRSGASSSVSNCHSSALIEIRDFPFEQDVLICRIGTNGRYKTLEIPLPEVKEVAQ